MVSVSLSSETKASLSMASPPASSLTSQTWAYDVFPSFSGEDVRGSFLSHLLKELDRKFVIAFKDNEMERGKSISPKLKQGIRSSRIAVVIFSGNYVSSSWCLNELVEIVRCKKKFGQLVITIFYRLDPSHVRKQTGAFGRIFVKTCRNKTEKVKVLWKKTLTDVANILGYHSVTGNNEAEMIEAISSDILDKLLKLSSQESEEFVGVEEHITGMNVLLQLESKEVRMVGILGSLGVGKTTIARALFNRLSRHFNGRIFIDRGFWSKSKEIYSGANPDDYNMKLHLQRIFLSEILGKRDIKINHLSEVERRLNNHKVLIFIDDVENRMVLDTLAGQTHWFGCGSRIIVITRHKHILKAHGIDHIHEVHLPTLSLSLEMFCLYAFRQKYPPDGFTELASELALRAGNLPLGLSILGSYLRGRDKEDWMDMLLRFRNGQYGTIEELLRFSYDGLNNKNDEAIFRHIACLLNGEQVSTIEELLEDTDLDVSSGLKNLVDKSLINVRSNTVEMHSSLQEIGKENVRGQSNEPGEREFLFDLKDVCHVLENNSGTEKVLGISLDIDENIDELRIHKEAFKQMSNLRFLKVWKDDLKEVRWHSLEICNYLPRKLKLLYWDRYPLRSMPSNFYPENLVDLQMQASNLEKLWDGIQSLTALKYMDLRGSENLKEIPDLSMAINLQILDLSYCSSLVELPSSIRYLNKLEKLFMSGCTKLETLPTALNLESLNTHILVGCSRLSTFPDISTNISFLDLSQIDIEEVPFWIENFTNLRVLLMRDCKKLERVYLNISKLKHLETADFSNCSELNVASLNDSPASVGRADDNIPPKLELNFINCFKLDIEALLQQKPVFKRLILSGEEVPQYFTHYTTGTSLTDIPLLQTSLSRSFFRFMACCTVVDSKSIYIDHGSFLIEVHCKFIDMLGNHFGSAYWPIYFSVPSSGSHVVIFNCCLPLDGDNDYLVKRHYDHVEIQFQISDDYSQLNLKGCGIRLSED